MSLNKVMLIGNVGRDPEVRYLEGGANGNAKVASFSVATTERYRDRNGETRENTDWHNVVAWRGNADVVEKYVKKGTQLYIEGRLKTREWTDQTGNKRYTTEVLVDNLQLLGRKSDNPASAQNEATEHRPREAIRPSHRELTRIRAAIRDLPSRQDLLLRPSQAPLR